MKGISGSQSDPNRFQDGPSVDSVYCRVFGHKPAFCKILWQGLSALDFGCFSRGGACFCCIIWNVCGICVYLYLGFFFIELCI